jgi:hypothetical protein
VQRQADCEQNDRREGGHDQPDARQRQGRHALGDWALCLVRLCV